MQILDTMERFLCIAGSARGHQFLRQCAELGVRPTLLTLDGLRDAAWPQEVVEDLATMPAGLSREQVLNTVSWMARGRRFNRVVALDETDLLRAAEIREHMRIPGMGITTAGYYRDRLAMRVSARESGFAASEFCRVLNYDDLREFMERVPAPWHLRPRTRTAGEQREQIESPEHLWRVLERLGDRQSHFVLEKVIEGERFIVESIISECRVVFSVVLRQSCLGKFDKPGGARLTETVDRTSLDWMELTALNGGVGPSLGMVRGVTHASFVHCAADGRYYFEEIAAGIGHAGEDELVEAASGLNLWREWARLETAHLRGETYVPQEWFENYAASLEWAEGGVGVDVPELRAAEVVSVVERQGMQRAVIRSARLEKVSGLVQKLCARLEEHSLVVG